MLCSWCKQPGTRKQLVAYDGFLFHQLVCLGKWLKWKEDNRGPTLRVEDRKSA